MSTFFEDGDFTEPVTCSLLRKSAPFADVNSFYIAEQDFMQFAVDFAPLALGTAHPVATSYKLVSESPLQDIGNGLVRWTRRYAETPDDRFLYEGFAHTFPGLTPGGIYTPKTLNPVGSLSGGVHTIESVAAHGYTAGDFVVIRCANPFLVDGNPFMSAFFPAYREVLNVGDSTHFDVDQIPGTDPTFIYAVQASDGRDPLTKSVMSKMVFEYSECANEAAVEALTILTPYTIIDGTGKQTDSLGFGSTPSQEDYIDDVVGTWIVAENSIVRQWEGLIHERATRYVRAE